MIAVNLVFKSGPTSCKWTVLLSARHLERTQPAKQSPYIFAVIGDVFFASHVGIKTLSFCNMYYELVQKVTHDV